MSTFIYSVPLVVFFCQKIMHDEAKQKGISDEEIENIVRDTKKINRYLRFVVKNKAVRKTIRTALQKLFKKDVT